MKSITRYSLYIFSCMVLVATSTVYSYAAQSARSALEGTVNAVLHELDKDELNNPATRDALLSRVEQIIRQRFSFEELSARTIGPQWRTFTPEQKAAFINEFSSLLRETYISKFEGYDGEKITYKNEVRSTDGSKIEIQTSIIIQGKDVPVSYRMLTNNNDWVIYDVIVEGISMVQNYRTQFKDILIKQDVDQLISQVKQKAEEARNHTKQLHLRKK